jgi:stringent starvation protein B
MISKKPYLIQAILDWIIDTECTPYLMVDATVEGVQVPEKFIDPEGQIVLNISVSAIHDLFIDKTGVSFKAKFSNMPFHVMVPMRAVRGLVSKEHGDGMIFPEEAEDDDSSESIATQEESKPKRPKFEIIR